MILLYDMQAVMGVLGHLQVRLCDTYASTILDLLLTNYESCSQKLYHHWCFGHASKSWCFFDIYIYIYVFIYMYISWYILLRIGKREHTTHAKLANIYIVEFVWCNHPLVVIEWPSLLVWHSHVTSQVAANTHGSKEAALRIIRWSLVLQGKVRHCQGWLVLSGRSKRNQEI